MDAIEGARMSAQPAAPPGPSEVTYLDRLREERHPGPDGAASLRRELATEREANKALLAALMEMDAKVATERSASKAVVSAIGELERQLVTERENAARWRRRASEAELFLIANAPKGQFTGSWYRRLRLRLR